MPGERLIGSYIVRVVVKDGRRLLDVYDVAERKSCRFQDFAELPARLAALESSAPGIPSEGTPRSEE